MRRRIASPGPRSMSGRRCPPGDRPQAGGQSRDGAKPTLLIRESRDESPRSLPRPAHPGRSAARGPGQVRPIALSPDHNHTRFMVRPPITSSRPAPTSPASTPTTTTTRWRRRPLGRPRLGRLSTRPGSTVPNGEAHRPDRWLAIPGLPKNVLSPDDASYRNSGFSRPPVPPRGPSRLGQDANFNSFVVANGCPQLQPFNGGIWNSWRSGSARVRRTCSAGSG